jgi:hypothetical protein
VPGCPKLVAACVGMDGGSGFSTSRRGVSLAAAPLFTPQNIQTGMSSQYGQRTPVHADQRPIIGSSPTGSAVPLTDGVFGESSGESNTYFVDDFNFCLSQPYDSEYDAAVHTDLKCVNT